MTSTLLRHARLIGRGDRPRDVLVVDGLIRSVGVPADADEVVDVDGRFVGPGLWDHHVHFSQWALVRRRIDVSGARSAAEASAIVAARIDTDPVEPGTVLVGFGFRDGLWPDEPTGELLEFGDAAVVLVSGDLHCVWANRVALAGLGRPGHAGGLLREQPAFDINSRLSAVPDDVMDAWVDEAARAAAARGVVGIVDLEMGYAPEQWRRRIASGTRSLRVRAGIYPEQLDRAIAEGLRTGAELDGTSGLGTMGPFKIITDGSLNTRTAYCHDPYPGLRGDNSTGLPTYEQAALVAWLRRATEHGLEPAVHAIGDLANSLALDAFAEVGCRGTIEHAQLIDAADFERFVRLGVTASVQPEQAMDDRDVADRHWAGRTDRAFALESLVAAGASLVLGSDAPVAPLDPFTSMAAAVTRSRNGLEPWHPEQRVSAWTGWAASTGGGSLALGDRADLVVTELDPLTASGDELRAMPVWATMIAGEWTHRGPA